MPRGNKLQQLKCLICRPSRQEDDEDENYYHHHAALRQQQQQQHQPLPRQPPEEDDSLLLQQAVARGAADAANDQKPPLKQQRRAPLMSVDNHQHPSPGEAEWKSSTQVARMRERLSLSSAMSASHLSSYDDDNNNYTPKSRIVSPKLADDENEYFLSPLHERQAQASEHRRRVSKTFRNIHPAHAKIKARLDVFEGRCTSFDLDTTSPLARSWLANKPTQVSSSSTTTTTDDSHFDYRRHRRSNVSRTATRDVQNDPYEYAYKIWYQKGLLAFRPKGME